MCNLIINAAPYPPPKKFSLALVMFGSKKITFSWSPVAPDCPAVHYNNILSSNCGSCPTTTATNKVTCDVRNHPESLCTFAVQRVVCGNITGNVSEYITLDITETMNELATSEEGTCNR